MPKKEINTEKLIKHWTESSERKKNETIIEPHIFEKNDFNIKNV